MKKIALMLLALFSFSTLANGQQLKEHLKVLQWFINDLHQIGQELQNPDEWSQSDEGKTYLRFRRDLEQIQNWDKISQKTLSEAEIQNQYLIEQITKAQKELEIIDLDWIRLKNEVKKHDLVWQPLPSVDPDKIWSHFHRDYDEYLTSLLPQFNDYIFSLRWDILESNSSIQDAFQTQARHTLESYRYFLNALYSQVLTVATNRSLQAKQLEQRLNQNELKFRQLKTKILCYTINKDRLEQRVRLLDLPIKGDERGE